MIDLYTWATPNGRKVSIMLEEQGLDYNVHEVNIGKGEQHDPEFLKVSPNNKIPGIVDSDGPGGEALNLFETGAILVYLAGNHGGESWLPTDPASQAAVQQWLSFAVNELWNGPAIARAKLRFNRDVDLPRAQALAADALTILDGRLAHRDWLALDRPTITDIACYPYSALAKEGGIPLEPYTRRHKS